MTSTPGDDLSPLSVTVSAGDTRASLAALRDLLARTLDACEVRHHRTCDCDCGPPPPRAADVSSLAARLADVLLRLEKLPASNRRSTTDDLAAKRRERRAQATGT